MNIEMPITSAIYSVLHEGKNANEVVVIVSIGTDFKANEITIRTVKKTVRISLMPQWLRDIATLRQNIQRT